MQELEEREDPFHTKKDIKKRRKERVKKNIIIITLVFIVIVSSLILYYIDKRMTYEVKLLTEYKCLSNCPTEIGSDPLNPGATARTFFESCKVYCLSLYGNLHNEYNFNKSRINVEEFNYCLRNTADPAFDSKACFDLFFFHHQNIYKFNEGFPMPVFLPMYQYVITDAACTQSFADLNFSYLKGPLNLTLYFEIQGINNQTYGQQKSMIFRGGTINQRVPYPPGISKEQVSGVYVKAITSKDVILTEKLAKCA